MENYFKGIKVDYENEYIKENRWAYGSYLAAIETQWNEEDQEEDEFLIEYIIDGEVKNWRTSEMQEVHKYSICQSIGICDINNKKIFTHDIVIARWYDMKNKLMKEIKGELSFSDAFLQVVLIDGENLYRDLTIPFGCKLEVVGNKWSDDKL